MQYYQAGTSEVYLVLNQPQALLTSPTIQKKKQFKQPTSSSLDSRHILYMLNGKTYAKLVDNKTWET